MAVGLKGLISRAELVARKRGHEPSTAHLLLVLHTMPEVRPLLDAQGVEDLDLLEVLQSDPGEPDNALTIVAERARQLARGPRLTRPGALHLMLALIREQRSAGYRCLERLGVEPAGLQSAIAERLARPQARSSGVATAPTRRFARRTLVDQSALLALETEQKRAQRRAERPSEPPAAPAQPAPTPMPAPAAPAAAYEDAHEPERAQEEAHEHAGPFDPHECELDPTAFPLLTSLGRNLSAAAVRGELDRVFGRDDEIERLLDVLGRRRANNPVLVGPPGVGKTAIVEGLALQLVSGQERGVLADSIVIELSAGALLSGTGVRGALAQRLDALCAEVEAAGRVLLFIDEIHGVVGQDDGADSLANGLKAALARGQLPCIGATTDEEYRRIFERDAALARRFTRVEVEEPAPEAALEILAGIAPEYEKHHAVPITQEALEAAVDMSVRYVRERQLPDKAIAVVDQAAARARRRGRAVVDVEAVAEVVSEQASIPLERLMMRDGEALVALDQHLARRVVGQPDAIAAIAGALRKGAAGFRGARPLGTFLFLGPTGVGKTEMAKAISELLFPGGEPTRFDMSELSESHGVARLLGAPPGYVGHEDGGQLTEAVRKRPYQLILLDEIEKAHMDVLLALLPLLDEGRLTDGRGRTVDFTNTVVVMTSNLGADATPRSTRARIGFGAGPGDAEMDGQREASLAAARAALPPELWNRIDEPLFFEPLDRADVASIAERMVATAAALMLREHGIAVSADRSAIESLIAAGGYDPKLGARPMRRTVGRLIEAPLARAVLAGEFSSGDVVLLRGEGTQIVVERGSAIDAAE